MTLGVALLSLSILTGIVASIRPWRELVIIHAGTAVAATAVLIAAFATEDWSNAYVVSTTRPGLGPLVRIAGLWGGAEGSLLLFAAFVAIAAFIVERMGGQFRPLTALASAYGVVILISANPFEQLDARAVGGLGLQPVLEHPAMTWHPPALYLGLVGVMVPGLLAVGGVGDRWVRAATGVSLALLTTGLATGAAWAHAELGWGGYWAWDPIESAGLVAWLATAATLHLRFESAKRLSRALFLLPALAAVWATTLTRAGLVQSVHAFADRPGLRAGLLIAAVSWTGLLGWLVASASPAVPTTGRGSRHRLIATFSLLMATGIVAIGTYEPAVEQAMGSDTVGIAGVFFARALWPVVIGAAVLAVRADRRLAAAVVGAVLAVLITPLSAGPFGLAVAVAGGAAAGSAALAGKAGRAGWLAHVAVGIALVGIAGTMAATVDQLVLTRDQPVEVNGQTFVHRGLALDTTRTQESVIATIEVDGVDLHPALVAHRLRNVPTAEAATFRSLLDETQVLLSDGTDASASYRINRTPRLNLVWFGLALLALGLLVGSRSRRKLVQNPVDG